MAANLVIADEAEDDLDDAFRWYEGRRIGLGEDFLRSVEARVQAILRTPEAHPIVRRDYRRALVRRFPYAIYYESDGGTVTVYGVFHTSSDPKKWRDRLP